MTPYNSALSDIFRARTHQIKTRSDLQHGTKLFRDKNLKGDKQRENKRDNQAMYEPVRRASGLSFPRDSPILKAVLIEFQAADNARKLACQTIRGILEKV